LTMLSCLGDSVPHMRLLCLLTGVSSCGSWFACLPIGCIILQSILSSGVMRHLKWAKQQSGKIKRMNFLSKKGMLSNLVFILNNWK
ncbi:hypothetical protein L9F63_001890, partial [Diploptera punctata]